MNAFERNSFAGGSEKIMKIIRVRLSFKFKEILGCHILTTGNSFFWQYAPFLVALVSMVVFHGG